MVRRYARETLAFLLTVAGTSPTESFTQPYRPSSRYLSQWRFNLEPLNHCDILLGLDWLRSTHAKLVWNGVEDPYDVRLLASQHRWQHRRCTNGSFMIVSERTRATSSDGLSATPARTFEDVDPILQSTRVPVEQIRGRLQAHDLNWIPRERASQLGERLAKHALTAGCVSGGSSSGCVALRRALLDGSTPDEDLYFTFRLRHLRYAYERYTKRGLRNLLQYLSLVVPPKATIQELRQQLSTHLRHLGS